MRNKKLIDPQQKFCQLLIDGMSDVENVEVECISAIPVSASTVSQKLFEEEDEIISPTLRYKYLGFRNGKILRYLTLYKNCRRSVGQWVKENEKEDTVIVCDVLSYFITRPAQKIAKKRRIKIVGIVTDLPLLSTNMKGRKESLIKKLGLGLFQHLTDRSLADYDAYIPLTKSIDEYVNKDNKPSLIIEGSVDCNELSAETVSPSEKKKIILYAGGIYEKYGLKNLVEAFAKASTNGYSLHIYGEGSYVDELKKMSKRYPKIQYMGMVTLDEIVKKEKEVMLLVNPRPSDEEFSKYSFPSKTLEYMVSGTPLITTRLPGIPKEYFDYVYTFDNEDIESMGNTLSNLCRVSAEELVKRGDTAKKFACLHKNNKTQAEKIISFIFEMQ